MSSEQVAAAGPSEAVRVVAEKPWWIPVAGAVGFLLLGVAWLAFPLDEWLDRFATWVRGFGIAGFIALGIVYAAGTLVFMPGTPMSIAAGVAFGWYALPLVLVSGLVSAAAAFLIARYFLRDSIGSLHRQRPAFRAVAEAVDEEGWRVVGVVRKSSNPFWSAELFVRSHTNPFYYLHRSHGSRDHSRRYAERRCGRWCQHFSVCAAWGRSDRDGDRHYTGGAEGTFQAPSVRREVITTRSRWSQGGVGSKRGPWRRLPGRQIPYNNSWAVTIAKHCWGYPRGPYWAPRAVGWRRFQAAAVGRKVERSMLQRNAALKCRRPHGSTTTYRQRCRYGNERTAQTRHWSASFDSQEDNHFAGSSSGQLRGTISRLLGSGGS